MKKIDIEDIVLDIRVDNVNSRKNYFRKQLSYIFALFLGGIPWLVIFLYSDILSGYILSFLFLVFYSMMFYYIKYPFANSRVFISREGIDFDKVLYKWENLVEIKLELIDEKKSNGLSIVFHLITENENAIFYLNNSFGSGWEKKFQRFFMAVTYFSKNKKLINYLDVMKIYTAKRLGVKVSDLK